MVLILVLVDHALGALNKSVFRHQCHCLNPCFSGPCSRSHAVKSPMSFDDNVLILVLVDHALGVKVYAGKWQVKKS